MDFLDRYATGFHQWRTTRHDGQYIHYRPMGVVESTFDSDGLYHEGRADIQYTITHEVRSSLTRDQFREHILLVLTCLRLSHILTRTAARSFDASFMDPDARTQWNRYFVVTQPADEKAALLDTKDSVTFLEDHFDKIDFAQLHTHMQNCSRIIQPHLALSRHYIHPLTRCSPTTYTLRITHIIAHQISDGMTTTRWNAHLFRLLNYDSKDLRASIISLLSSFTDRLIPAQEDLYPPITGSQARQRWFWAITLVLRHVARPLPACFQNPLRRTAPLAPSLPPEPIFAPILSYDRPPTLNGGGLHTFIPPASASVLNRLCKAAHCSTGAGMFVLVALTMMDIHSIRSPSSPPLPFIGSFPIDPRSSFGNPQPDSCMLAFSPGVVLPFLDPSLPTASRFKLLVRSAQRQLSQYQKRPQRAAFRTKAQQIMTSRLLQLNYLNILLRVDAVLPPERRSGFIPGGPELAPPPLTSLATCGVSSIGKPNPELAPGTIRLDDETKAFAAEIAGGQVTIRPREGEFLVGVMGAHNGAISLQVSYDACAMDPVWVRKWGEHIVHLLDGVEADENGGAARL